MRIVEVPFSIDLRSADGAPMGHGRPAGHHVSELVRGVLGKQWKSIEGEQENVRAHFGFLFEVAIELILGGASPQEAIALAFKLHQKRTRPVLTQIRLCLDDISGTPDGLHQEDHWLESYKATWRSERHWNENAAENFRSWFLAEAVYIYMATAVGRYPPIPGVRFFVFWVNGDYTYRTGHGPAVKQYLVTYSGDEVQRAWRTILAQAKLLDRNRAKRTTIKKRDR